MVIDIVHKSYNLDRTHESMSVSTFRNIYTHTDTYLNMLYEYTSYMKATKKLTLTEDRPDNFLYGICPRNRQIKISEILRSF